MITKRMLSVDRMIHKAYGNFMNACLRSDVVEAISWESEWNQLVALFRRESTLADMGHIKEKPKDES